MWGFCMLVVTNRAVKSAHTARMTTFTTPHPGKFVSNCTVQLLHSVENRWRKLRLRGVCMPSMLDHHTTPGPVSHVDLPDTRDNTVQPTTAGPQSCIQ